MPINLLAQKRSQKDIFQVNKFSTGSCSDPSDPLCLFPSSLGGGDTRCLDLRYPVSLVDVGSVLTVNFFISLGIHGSNQASLLTLRIYYVVAAKWLRLTNGCLQTLKLPVYAHEKKKNYGGSESTPHIR
eukprot:354713-Pelagomonas_calceolata.AAC.3